MKKFFCLVFFLIFVQNLFVTPQAFAQSNDHGASYSSSEPTSPSPFVSFFQKIGAWFKKAFSTPSTANAPKAVGRAIRMNENQTSYYGGPTPIGAVPTKFPTQAGRIEVLLPQDRCKAGVIRFGSLECSVLGRGMTEDFPIAGYLQGTHNNGQTCYYKPATKFRGATPTGLYKVSGIRPHLPDKAHWGRDGWSIEPIRLAPPLKDDRGGFVLHSDQNDGGNIDYRSTWGCLKIDSSCQDEIDQYIKSNRGSGKGVIINVQEDQ